MNLSREMRVTGEYIIAERKRMTKRIVALAICVKISERRFARHLKIPKVCLPLVWKYADDRSAYVDYKTEVLEKEQSMRKESEARRDGWSTADWIMFDVPSWLHHEFEQKHGPAPKELWTLKRFSHLQPKQAEPRARPSDAVERAAANARRSTQNNNNDNNKNKKKQKKQRRDKQHRAAQRRLRWHRQALSQQ